MKIQLFLSFVFLFSGKLLFAQLGGTYTVGQATDDFPDINDAITEIQDHGTTSPVTLVVSDGQYGMLDLSYFQPLSGDSLVIRSASGNPENVRFAGANFTSADNVTLIDLGFYKTTTNGLSLFKITSCNRFFLKGCRIVDEITTQYNFDESTLSIQHSYDSTMLTRVFVDSCYISSLDGVNPVNYNFTLFEKGSYGKTYYHADTILGGWRIWSYYREFSDCHLEFDEGAGEPGNAVFDRCKLHFLGTTNNITAGRINECYFSSENDYAIYLTADTVLRCDFNSDLNVQYITFFGGNTFRKNFSTQGFFNFFYMKNVFLDKVTMTTDFTLGVNNFFTDTATISGSLYHNNFGPNSLLTLYGGGFQYQQNNFGRIDNQFYPVSGMLGNNYMASDDTTLYSAYFDPMPTFYDPEYITSTDLHIQNPALAGHGIPVTFWAQDDIDNQMRSTVRPSIGADEICISLPLRDTVLVQCGTDFVLKSCDMPGLQWKPDAIIFGPVNERKVTVDAPKLVWLEDTQGNHIDSMYLLPSLMPASGKRTFPDVHCDFPNQYAVYVPAGATLTWEPESAVSDPASNIVTIVSYNDMQVLAHVNAGVCGSWTDTLDITVDPTPTAIIMWDSLNCRDFYAHGYYRCVDSVLWDFGDGVTSTDMDLTMHTYAQTGDYLVSLTGWNEGIAVNQFFHMTVGCIGLEEVSFQSLKIYPNPAKEHLKIEVPETSYPLEYVISDQSGRILKRGKLEKDQQIGVGDFSRGLYIVSAGEMQALFIKE